MRVEFERTGERRYGVRVRRDRASDLRMHPAPGWDDHLPHDLVHFLVEREVGLRDGIFGQLAAGGDARTFVPTDEQRTRRWARRSARRNQATGRDVGRSEQLAAAGVHTWMHRHGVAHHRPPVDDDLRSQVERTLPALDDAAGAWGAVRVGGSLVFAWPWPERG